MLAGTVARGGGKQAIAMAIIACAAIMAFDITGRSARDALFLANYPATSLPPAMLGAAVLSVILGFAVAHRLRYGDLATLLAGLLVASAAVAGLEVTGLSRSPGLTALALYLHFNIVNGLFVSWFWIMIFEYFDPRAARRAVGRIAAAGTVGGLLGGLAAERIGAALTLSAAVALLAGLNLVAALAVLRLRAVAAQPVQRRQEDIEAGGRFPALVVLRKSRFVRVILAIVVLGAIAETLLDFVLMSRAGAALGTGPALLRFFATFYTGVAVVTLLLQISLTGPLLNRLGISRTGAILPAGLVAGGAGALLVPGLTSAALARGMEMVLRNSMFRAGYELLFNALPPADKRAVKTTVDVTAVRSGRIIGSTAIQLLLVTAPARAVIVSLSVVVATGAAALALFRGLSRINVQTLAGNLVARAPVSAKHRKFDTTMLPVLSTADVSTGTGEGRTGLNTDDRYAVQYEALTSGSAHRIIHALQTPVPTPLVDVVIPLLARENVGRIALRALQYAPHDAVPKLARAMLDAELAMVVRRRLAFALAGHATIEARDALLRGLDDERFEVRVRCGAALARLISRERALAPPYATIMAVVGREVAVDIDVWERRALLPRLPADEAHLVLGEVIEERADRSLAHVFTLLGLVLPTAPLQAAYRGLNGADPYLRGTALEYLEQVLPANLRRGLWHILEESARHPRARDPAGETDIEAAVRQKRSLEFELDRLREAKAKPSSPGGEPTTHGDESR